MSEDFFQIDKKEILSKFKELVNKHSEREDDYNPSTPDQQIIQQVIIY